MRQLSKRTALKALLAAPLAALFLRGRPALAIPASEIDGIYDALGTYIWSGPISLRYPPTNERRGLIFEGMIDDMTFKIDSAWKLKGGLMMHSESMNGSRSWARFEFDGYMVNSEAENTVQLVIEGMDLVPNYSAVKSYDIMGTEQQQYEATSDYIVDWPRCHGFMDLGWDAQKRKPTIATGDHKTSGSFTMEQYDTGSPVTIWVTAL